jgi:hypothetical protein
MAICGTLNPDGTVSVQLVWTQAAPVSQIRIEVVSLVVHGTGTGQLIPVTDGGKVVLSNLSPGTQYDWSVITEFNDGTELQSAQASFTTPAAAKQPATNLVCALP